MTRTFIAFLLYYLNFLLARQLSFSIDGNGLSFGTLTPFDQGTIDANDLRKPPNGSRNLELVHKTTISSLFVDGLKPFTGGFEYNQRNCPTNCPDSERGANGSFISRLRRAMLCVNDTLLPEIFNFTCSVPCPAWEHALPRIVWMKNETVVRFKAISQQTERKRNASGARGESERSASYLNFLALFPL